MKEFYRDIWFYGMYETVQNGATTVYLKIRDWPDFIYFKVQEDPQDEYRSSGEILEVEEIPEEAIFNFESAPFRVSIVNGAAYIRGKWEYPESFTGLVLYYRDKIIGKFGTENFDDWYPCFIAYLDIPLINELI